MNEGGFLLEEKKEDKRFFRLSFWWVEHRAVLKRLGYLFFILVDVFLLLFVFWHFLDAFAISSVKEERAVAQMVAYGQSDLNTYTRVHKAHDLIAGRPQVFSTGGGRYDLYTTLQNPNTDWWAEFTYSFTTNNEQTDSRQGFILPGEEKPVVILGIESITPLVSPSFSLETVRWHRVDHHLIADYQTWAKDRLAIIALDAQFSQETYTDGKTYGQTTFSLKNETAFSYYDLGLFVLLKRGSSVVGINRTTLSAIESGEKVNVTLNWFGTLPSVTQVEIIPELNVFDLDVYKSLSGETTRDTRTRVFR
ncbi:MAG: hypothetical protein UT30_C0006G0025 [Candidatus Uhrbacteria bacterium GW2011_GWF2_39_13]|uniref:Uncharacterized protein n=1 Tax=Candidatus Uhrbacteria bacterium GW2011_GWF2_39_13 TaxID=1618995 RepID=A0A0G0MVR4_9BACT|nr:MAG: hypothetical protein UT30_C0006G0025 [Candidatus Uhrbacteria bacterium GW2011_GWF2_39_13]